MLARRSLIVFTVATITVWGSAFAIEDGTQLKRWDRTVCLRSPPVNDTGKGHVASAFVVSNAKSLFLVTAAHAAEQTEKRTRLLYQSVDGKPQWVSLGVLMPNNGNPWSRHKSSDLSIAKIEIDTSSPYFKELSRIAIPANGLSTKPVGRTTEIEFAGFPLGLGIEGQVSPLVVVGTVASKEILTKNDWGTEPMIYCSPDVAQGTSGGPVFLAANSPLPATVVGMYVGVVYDASGGKLSKLVPSRIIHQAIMAKSQSVNSQRRVTPP